MARIRNRLALGPNCDIDDLDAIARRDRACDDIGIDTIETGNAIAVAMEGGVKERESLFFP